MKTGVAPLQPAILVAPLDWGLGHATRCIPIVRALVANNCTVYLAGEGPLKALLQSEFPSLHFLDLKGYRVHYGVKSWQLPLQIIRQVPGILKTIAFERRWVRQQVQILGIDGVISDSRFGLSCPSIPTCFVTHQLKIKSGLGTLADWWLQKLNYKYIDSFSECWVPDLSRTNNLAGELSHPRKKPDIPISYLGVLSRFSFKAETVQKKYILCMVSGPEPQRSLFEKMILSEIGSINISVVLVRGKPGTQKDVTRKNGLEIHDHLTSRELEEKIAFASYVVCRSGYSSVMDLMRMKKKCILIPTPGQPEQAYIARHLMRHHLALCVKQKHFKLKGALQQAEQFKYCSIEDNNNKDMDDLVNSFIRRCIKNRSDNVAKLL